MTVDTVQRRTLIPHTLSEMTDQKAQTRKTEMSISPKESFMKIDTTQIPNFDALPDDAKTAILGMEFADAPDMSKFVEKSVFDKKASEASELSKQLKAKMTDEENAKSEAEQAMKDLQEKYTVLLRESTISKHTASYMAMPGYDEKLAKEAAEALADNNTAKLFEIQQKAAEAAAKQIKDELTRKDPRPGGAGGGEQTEKTKAVQIAEKIGKDRSATATAANDILSKYIGGK